MIRELEADPENITLAREYLFIGEICERTGEEELGSKVVKSLFKMIINYL